MKKYLFLLFIMLLCLSGCGKKNVYDVIGDFSKKVEDCKSYKLTGTMEISSGEELFVYSIESNYLKDNYYKVKLINETNNHEQIILKNTDGLYVVTPSLNKSFKFDSIWPDNSSQAYLLHNLVKDLKNDNDVSLESNDDGYIVKAKVSYPNNEELVYEKLYFDKSNNLIKVLVFNNDDIAKIVVTIKDINYKAKLSEEDFKLEGLINNSSDANSSSKGALNKDSSTCDENSCETDTTSSIDTIVYPLYIPENTHLSNADTVMTDDGGRFILSFTGDKNFVIVEETASIYDDFEVIPVFGDPVIINESVGVISNNSITWADNNICYYLVSSDMQANEMINVAKSLTGTRTVMSIK